MSELELPVSLLGGTWLVTNLLLGLRLRIRERWDLIFGLTDSPPKDLKTREYLLKKDIGEDMWIIFIILAVVALVFFALGVRASGFSRGVFMIAGCCYVAGAVAAALMSRREYRRWWAYLHGAPLYK